MAARTVSVTTAKRPAGEIAEVFTTAVTGWLRLERLGLVDLVRPRLRLERKDGCGGLELFGLLFLMAMARLTSQRALQRSAAHCKRALADVLGVRTFRSQSSMSRALQSVTREQSAVFGDWLLGDALAVGELERDSSAFHLDTFGEPWRMVDFDGRVHAIRQRALAESPELPEPRRRSAQLAKPGYSGRKRGQVQYHRMIVQDAGTARFLGVRLGPGNGDHRSDVQWAVGRVALWADALGVARRRVCARFDGKATGAPALLDSERAGLSFLTRWTSYDVLEQPDVRMALELETWQVVADSGSGPRREAMELGSRSFCLPHDDLGADDHSSHLEARVVVSRYRADPQGHQGSGKQKGAFVYELYITNLPAASWPAGELVELYYGRVVEENRFEQADSEQGRQRVVSWHLPGQELAIAVSLFAWNLRLTWGADLVGWTAQPEPRPLARRPQLVEPTISRRQEPCSNPIPEAPSLETAREAEVSSSEKSTDTEVPKKAKPARPYLARGLLCAALVTALEWPRLLEGHPGWRWDADQKELRCPAGEGMIWRKARRESPSRLSLIFRIRSQTACQTCSQRRGCTSSRAQSFRKELWLSVESSLLAQSPKAASCHQGFSVRLTAPDDPGPWSIRGPTLIPSELRVQPAQLFSGCRVSATPGPVVHTSPHPKWSAATKGARQHSRNSWESRDGRGLLPANHRLDIHIHLPRELPASTLRNLIAATIEGRNHR